MKAKIAIALGACLALSGCLDTVVRRQATGLSVEVERTVECQRAGYCYANFYDQRTASYRFGFGYSYNCPGLKEITVRRTPMEYEYASGAIRHFVREDIVREGICR